MAKLVRRKWSSTTERGVTCYHYCPACKQLHGIRTEGPIPLWTWNGDFEKPTFQPSVRNFTTYDDEGEPLPKGQDRTLCHYYVKNGNIEYCGDNPHALNEQTVPLPEIPAGWFDSETQD